MRLLLILSVILLVVGCSAPPEEKAKEITFEFKDIPLSKKLKKGLKHSYLNNIGIDEKTADYLYAFYEERDFQPFWINDSTLNENGEKLKHLLLDHLAIGIPSERNEYNTTYNFIQDELAITANLSHIIYDLQNGLIDYETKTSKPIGLVDRDSLKTMMSFDFEADLRPQFIKFGPADTTYEILANGLIELIQRYPLDTATFEVRSVKYDSTVAIDKARIALISKGYIDESVTDSVGIVEALKIFQVENGLKPDGVIGKFTSKCLNESTRRKAYRIILAMDKIRAEREYPEKYIRINIPEYRLRFYSNDSLRSVHNIVVGKFENQTPELESKLRKIVVYPYWKVPYSISSKEILPAARWNSGYFAKHNYKIYKNDIEVDPLTVNWKRIRQNAFPYKVIQQPGLSNSLGIIKFDFYNPHSVYFHDTPAKSLFGVDVRAYSHGCMRTQNPVDLAKKILLYDSISPRRMNAIRPDSLDSLLGLEENYEIPLKERIPIYVDYVSVARSDSNEMIIYHDVYGRDEEYIKILTEKKH